MLGQELVGRWELDHGVALAVVQAGDDADSDQLEQWGQTDVVKSVHSTCVLMMCVPCTSTGETVLD